MLLPITNLPFSIGGDGGLDLLAVLGAFVIGDGSAHTYSVHGVGLGTRLIFWFSNARRRGGEVVVSLVSELVTVLLLLIAWVDCVGQQTR